MGGKIAMKATGIIFIIVGAILLVFFTIGFFAQSLEALRLDTPQGVLGLLATAIFLGLGIWFLAVGGNVGSQLPPPNPCPGLSSCPNPLSS
jgi:hypothetical protein